MNDPGQAPITVRLFGEDLPLRLTRRGLRRAEYDSRTPLFGASGADQFWEQMSTEIRPFQLVVLVYAGLVHLNRFTFDQVDEAMTEENFGQYAAAVVACAKRDFPAPAGDAAKQEPADAPPFEPPTTTG